jgi:hypothetical protein
LTVGKQNPTLVDVRFGDAPRYHLTEPKDIDMRVPDQIRDCVVFVGVPGEMPDPEYRGTAFIVTVPGTQENSFAYLVTARHVAEHLEGREFYIRVNHRNGTAVAMRGRADNPWFYHPTDKRTVDAAVTLFAPAHLSELAVDHIPIAMFADKERIEKSKIGVGDEVFITGLFTKVTETTRNLPIVRMGNVAMIPDEKIPFGDCYIDAYLIESRSIGGLSGSPVFVRETLTLRQKVEGCDAPMPVIHGCGRFFFLGSVIGHWDVPAGFTHTRAEAVNMGIAPIVPAEKIKEIILQPELVESMKHVDAEIAAEKRKGAVNDFAPSKKEQTAAPFSQEDFNTALKKVSRKVENKRK